ncbi:MAG: Tetratricopeptide (TPR) repeat [Chloroflexi bacterium AL-W]|nr:Tetratricopeptide (TPR) repeat [Chloroflexi bacterium AL-N1]NOK69999.1 Tetratricopeptide (TPR) repeat [Chloroflexi bacterium AL-N10]NOK73703.1 Tetratricopeptide (TPR) repeat [Chloroflexi bacterium AL-N5]NOK85531.1 Tetratricopeptide (TPR) repeat [Chloroflexi bacterium AL-W]NOK91732.1 Tetratricopeptide (TPR) repeat [Chloroflexi bacterium AL-N15]
MLSPPQTARTIVPLNEAEDASRRWSQILSVLRDFSTILDPYANDANAEIRRLSRIIRMRAQPDANDYFVLGDSCARFAFDGQRLRQAYVEKTIAAYSRAGSFDATELPAVCAALRAFAAWVAQMADTLSDYESFRIGCLVCERALQCKAVVLSSADAQALEQLKAQLDKRLVTFFDAEQTVPPTVDVRLTESRAVCDHGQMLLRQDQAFEALELFEQALQIYNEYADIWLWRAMALADLGRFEDALASYDRALVFEPKNAGLWNGKGRLLLALGRMEGALTCFGKALQFAVDLPVVKATYWLNIGKALYTLGRYQDASDALQQSHLLAPSTESDAGIAACKDRLSEDTSSI